MEEYGLISGLVASALGYNEQNKARAAKYGQSNGAVRQELTPEQRAIAEQKLREAAAFFQMGSKVEVERPKEQPEDLIVDLKPLAEIVNS